ncbi:MAG: c-type cytochrome [Hyphomicrobiaceae bacterium]
MTSRTTITILGAIAAVIGASAFIVFVGRGEGERVGATLRPDDVEVVARGRQVYIDQCGSCHGKDLEGEPNWKQRDDQGYLPAPPHDSSGHTWHHTDQHLFELTKYGLTRLAGPDYKTRMPAYAGVLSDEDIIAALSFIKSRWPANIRKRHDQLNAAGQQ